MDPLAFIEKLIPVLEKAVTMLLIGVICCGVALLQERFHFNLLMAIGSILVAIYLPLVIWQAILKKKSAPAVSQEPLWDEARHKEIMRRGEEALARSRRSRVS